MHATQQASGVRRAAGRRLFWLGVGVGLASPWLYVLQLRAAWLVVPWYLLALALLAVGLLVASLVRQVTVWRVLALLFFALFAGFQGYALVAFTGLPAYTGPVVVGATLPPFTASLPDGEPFTHHSLRAEQNTILTFFRGRW